MDESAKRERLRSRPAADGCLRFEHANGFAGGGEDDGRGEPIGTGADDDRVDLALSQDR